MDDEDGSIAGGEDIPRDTAQEDAPDAGLTSGSDDNEDWSSHQCHVPPLGGPWQLCEHAHNSSSSAASVCTRRKA